MTGAAVPVHEPEAHVIRFRGHQFEPLPSGALYWAARETLLVADLHLEKMSSFARGGRFLPPYDTGMTLKQLETDLRRTGANRLIALGDSFHRDEGTSSLLPTDRTRLSGLTGECRFVWISGNHDPSPHALGGECATRLVEDGLTFAHEPVRDIDGLVAGHLHPAARLRMEGRSTRRACFAYDSRLMVLPAYGASTGSLNIRHPAFGGLFDWSELQVTMLGRDRTYPVNTRRLVAG